MRAWLADGHVLDLQGFADLAKYRRLHNASPERLFEPTLSLFTRRAEGALSGNLDGGRGWSERPRL
jgi:hypothetical protein